jgi:hypothetical protein
MASKLFSLPKMLIKTNLLKCSYSSAGSASVKLSNATSIPQKVVNVSN